MSKTREQIKHDPVSSEVWRPQKTQAGGMWFDPLKIKPLGNHILVVLDEETPLSPVITTPDVARNREIGSRVGTVVAVGPGKREEDRRGWTDPIPTHIVLPLRLKPMTLKPGDRVVIGHYSDWESWGCDYEGRAANVVLCQEADARVTICEVQERETCGARSVPAVVCTAR